MIKVTSKAIQSWVILLGSLITLGSARADNSCLRVMSFLTDGLNLGQQITFVSKRGNPYSGTYQGVENKDFIALEAADGHTDYLKIDRIDVESMIPESFVPRALPDPGPSKTTSAERSAIEGLSGSAKERAERFFQKTSEKRNPAFKDLRGQVPPFASVRNIGAETLLVADDPVLDPALHKWLKDTRDRFPNSENALSRARAITDHVSNTFKYGGGGLLHPVRRYRFGKMTGKEVGAERLGNFIKNGTGFCLPQSVTLQLALQNSGVPSRLVIGTLEVLSDKGESESPPERHAWIVVSGPDGREFILDPSHRVQSATRAHFAGPDDKSVDTDRAPRTVEGRHSAQYRYTPEMPGISAPGELLHSNFSEFLPALTRGSE